MGLGIPTIEGSEGQSPVTPTESPDDRPDPRTDRLVRPQKRPCPALVQGAEDLPDRTAAAIPVMAGEPGAAWLVGGAGALIVVLEGLQQLQQYQQNWASYRATCERLKHERSSSWRRPAPTPPRSTPKRCWPSGSRGSSPRSTPPGSPSSKRSAGRPRRRDEPHPDRPAAAGLHLLPPRGHGRLRRADLRRAAEALRRGSPVHGRRDGARGRLRRPDRRSRLQLRCADRGDRAAVGDDRGRARHAAPARARRLRLSRGERGDPDATTCSSTPPWSTRRRCRGPSSCPRA